VSYLAIARKYRPATFDEIVGQEHVTRTLRNAIEMNRVHHGFLFTGARGVGKTTAARALARSLNCERGPTPDPCGTCTSCVEIAAGHSPDLIEIDGASNNSVDDVRELREAVRFAPTQGRWKIYLVDEVHMLSKAAFNALLKTLEEPPPHVVFIFATTEPGAIPDTILSRVQRFDFKRISVPGVVGRLREIATAEGVTISDASLRRIARAGEGSMRDAQSLLDQVIAYAGATVGDDQVAATLGLVDRTLLYDMLSGLVKGEPDACLGAIRQVYDYGFELSEFTGELLEVVRNATFVRLSPGSRQHIDVSAEELAQLDAIVGKVPSEALSRLFSALLDVHDQVSRASRPRIVLEMAVARLAAVRPALPIGALVERLEAMDQRLRAQGVTARPTGLRAGREPRSTPRRDGPPGDDDRGGRPAPQAEQRPSPPPVAKTSRRTEPDTPAPPRPKVEPPAPRQRAEREPPMPPPIDDDFYDAVATHTDEVEFAPDPGPMSAHVRGGPAAEPTPEQRWLQLGEALRDTRAAMFAKGVPEWAPGQPLRVAFTRPRLVAEARRAVDTPEMRKAMALAYPSATKLEVLDRAVTGSPEGDLMRQAKTDSRVTRVVEALGGTLERAYALTTPTPGAFK